MDKKLISIIIPVYNVEEYVTKCVRSVLSQTYEDLDVIIVDDGSTDGCPELCDGFARGDSRVRVIHKANGGLSDARNVGLDVTRGAYIGFVDSDDWVEPDMFARLAESIQTAGADISVCNFSYEREKATADYPASMPAEAVQSGCILDRRSAMKLLLEDKVVQNYVWNKLYRAELWDGVRFPVGQAFEDVNTTWKVFERADFVVVDSWVGYRYRVRAGSIVTSKSLRSELDCFFAGLSRLQALSADYPESVEEMTTGLMHCATTIWGIAWGCRRDIHVSAEMRTKLGQVASFAKEHLPEYMARRSDLGVTGRMTLRLLPYARSWSYGLAHVLREAYLLMHPWP